MSCAFLELLSLVAVVISLIRAIHWDIEIRGLSLAERRELDVEHAQVSTGDFLIKLFGKHAVETCVLGSVPGT